MVTLSIYKLILVIYRKEGNRVKISKGLVLEINKNKAIVLTNDGQFLERKFAGKSPQIGSEIDLNPFQVNWVAWSKIGIAAIFALVFIPLLVLQLFIYPQMTVAYVTVDINPSIELGLNKYDKVTTVQGLNQEGINLLNKIQIKKLPVDKALEIVTEEAIKERYINIDKENAIIISYSPQKPIKNNEKLSSTITNTETKFEQNLLEDKVIEVIERNQQKAIVELINVSDNARSEASELGISTGKYTLMLEAWDEGIEISHESIKANNIFTAIKENGANPGHFISQVKQKNHSANELEHLTLKYEAKLKELKIKDKNEILKDGQGDSVNKPENKVTTQKPQSFRIGTEDEAFLEVNDSTDEEEPVENDDKERDEAKVENENQMDKNNSNSKNNITEEKNDNKPGTDKEIGNNGNQENNSQENRAPGSKDKYPSSNEAEDKQDNNNNREKVIKDEETNDKQDKNDNRDEKQKNEEIEENKDQDKDQELNNYSKDKISPDSNSNEPNNLRSKTNGAARYKGFNLNELPENIRLMLMELMQKRNK